MQAELSRSDSHKIFLKLKSRLSSSSSETIVADEKALLKFSMDMLKALCEELHISFDPSAKKGVIIQALLKFVRYTSP